MTLKFSVAATLVIFSSVASAQTTNCHWVGQTWTCDTRPPRTEINPNIISGSTYQPLDYGKILQQRAQLQAQQAQIDAQTRAYWDAQRRQQQEAAAMEQREALKLQVGKLIGGGDCAGAQSAALVGGDIELANQVKTYCTK